MSGEFVDLSSKADVTPSILKQLIDDAQDQDTHIESAESELLERTKAGTVTPIQVVNLAVLLVSAKTTSFIERGVFNLTELLRDSTKLEREVGFCALYHLALGHYKLGDPRTALGEVSRLLEMKSFHTSALALKQLSIDRMIAKQKNSGLFSRLFSKKDLSSSSLTPSPPLPIMSPEEEELKRQEDERKRQALASMFASAEGPEIDEDALIREIIAEDNQRHFDSTSPRVILDENSGFGANNRASFVSTATSSSPYGQQRDSYQSDFNGAGATAPSMKITSAVPIRMPHQRASMWVRSKRATQDLSGLADMRNTKPHDSLPIGLLKKRTRPLRASQSARSAPSAEYLANLTGPSTPNQGKEDGTMEDPDDESEDEEEDDIEPFQPPQFSFEPYVPSPDIGRLEAQLKSLPGPHAEQEEQLKLRQQADIARCQTEYQELLQRHQAAQYELLRRQQEEVSALQTEQMALMEEEKCMMALPLAEQSMDAMLLLQQKMMDVTGRQSPLLLAQQQSQVKIVADQQEEQKQRQEAFKVLLAGNNQQIFDLRATQANELLDVQGQISQLKQFDYDSYEMRRSMAGDEYRAHVNELMAQWQASKDAKYAERLAKRQEREKERARKAEEARARKEEEERSVEAEKARQIAFVAEQQRIEDSIRAQQEALHRQQQELARQQEEALLLQLEQQQDLLMQVQLQADVDQAQRQADAQTKANAQALQAQAEAKAQADAKAQARKSPPKPRPPSTGYSKPTATPTPASVKTNKPMVPPKGVVAPLAPTAATPAEEDVIDVFALTRGTALPVAKPTSPPPTAGVPKVSGANATAGAGSMPPPSGKIALAAVAGAPPPMPLNSPPLNASRPPSTLLPPTPATAGVPAPTATFVATASGTEPGPLSMRPKSAKMPARKPPPPPSVTGATPSAAPPTSAPPSGPPTSAPPSGPPSAAPPSAPPSSALPPLPSTGPPPSRALPKAPASEVPPAFLANSGAGGGRPQPPAGGRPQPPAATVTANLQAFSEKQNYSRPAPPMPAVSSGPPTPRIPTPNGDSSSTSGPATSAKLRPGPPMPTVQPPSSSGKPPVSAAPSAPYGAASSSAAPNAAPSEANRGVSRQELVSATSSDTRKVTKDKAGLPVSSSTHKGAHLLATASRAKGPARRPPGQR